MFGGQQITGLAALMAALVLAGCGGKAASINSSEAADESELRQLLLNDLAARGIDADKAPSRAPSGALSPTLLQYVSMGGGVPSPESPQQISFYVRTMISGDCDFNGVVNISDVTRLAWWMQAVQPDVPFYLKPEQAYGQIYYPNYFGPARSDGDRNGKLTISDVTAIGVHYGERLDGWHIYVKLPSDSEFKVLMDRENPAEAYFISRNPQTEWWGWFTVVEAGTTEFYVVPVDTTTGQEGTASKTFTYVSNEQPLAEFTISHPNPTTADLVTLDGSKSSDPDGTISGYRWIVSYDGPASGNESYQILNTDNLSSEVRFLQAGTYTISFEASDDRGGVGLSTEQTLEVTVGGERNPDWQFSDALPVSNQSGSVTDLQEIAGRAALITSGYMQMQIVFASSPPDGSAWTEPMVVLQSELAIIAPALGEVAGRPTVAGVHFYSIANLSGGAPLEYCRALDPEGTSWPAPLQLDRALFGDGIMQIADEPYIFATQFPYGGHYLWHGSDPDGSDLTDLGTSLSSALAVDGYRYSLRSSGQNHYIVNRDGNQTEVFHSTDALTWNKAGTVWNPPLPSQSYQESSAYIVDGRLALLWSTGQGIFFSIALDAAASQWIPVKTVTTDVAAQSYAYTAGVAFLDGAPAIAYADSNYVLKLIRATNSNGTQWDRESQETISSYGILRDCDLEIIGGQPALTVYNHSTGKIEYARRL